MDLLNVMLIGLPKEVPEHSEGNELHRLLGILLSDTLEARQKLDIMETEYDIPIEDSIRKDVKAMCNLGQGIWEKAEAAGKAEGKAEMIIAMLKSGYPYKEVAKIANLLIEEVKKIEEEALALAK